MRVSTEELLGSPRELLIDGELVRGDHGLECVDPNDGRGLGEIPEASDAQVDAAAEAAWRAFRTWRDTDVAERGRVVLSIARLLRERRDGLAMLEAVSGGMPLRMAHADIERAAGQLEYLAGLAWEVKGTTVPSAPGSLAMTVREPYGPTARLTAFNHPVMFSAARIGAPLLTGNTVVLKIPEQASLAPLLFASIIADVAPPGVINVVCGRGGTTGAALVGHPRIARVAFIGSVATGKAILRACAERVVPAGLELGGKNPLIVCADADPHAAARTAVAGMNYGSAGQSCGSLSRVLVHRSLYPAVTELIARQLDKIVVGHALDESTEMGPLINAAARDRIVAAIEGAGDRGARIATGGVAEFPDLGAGYFARPTLLSDVDPGDPVCREELFGPVQVIVAWDDVDEAIELANDSEYGLVSCVHTKDVALAVRIAKELDTGSVAVNGKGGGHWRGVPFGGFKSSGLGKEEDINELLESTRLKSLVLADQPTFRKG